MMKDDDFKLMKGFALGQTHGRTDICDCRVAFLTENQNLKYFRQSIGHGSIINLM